MERSFVEVIAHSGPVAVLLLLASLGCSAMFLYRAWGARRAEESGQGTLTDGMLFLCVIAFVGFLLLLNLADAVSGLTAIGVDADRPLAVAVENIFVYGGIGAVLVVVMMAVQILKRR